MYKEGGFLKTKSKVVIIGVADYFIICQHGQRKQVNFREEPLYVQRKFVIFISLYINKYGSEIFSFACKLTNIQDGNNIVAHV